MTAEERVEVLQKSLDRELFFILEDYRNMPFKAGQKTLQERLKTLKMVKDLIQKKDNIKQKKDIKVLKWIIRFFPWLLSLLGIK